MSSYCSLCAGPELTLQELKEHYKECHPYRGFTYETHNEKYLKTKNIKNICSKIDSKTENNIKKINLLFNEI